MVVVLRTNGLRIVIYRSDHDPAHVHIFGDGETKIELTDGPDTIRVIYALGVRKSEKRRAERAVRDNHAHLVARWNELHG
ncbi:MAG: DUF4160 domain-containing protein [Sphingomonas taxi]